MPTISQRAIENMDYMVTGMGIDEGFKVSYRDCSYSYQVQFTTLATKNARLHLP